MISLSPLSLAALQVAAAPLILTWRELTTITVAVAIVWLSYALKESLATRRHVHITRTSTGEDAGPPPSEGG